MKLVGLKLGKSKNGNTYANMHCIGEYTGAELKNGAYGQSVVSVMVFGDIAEKVTSDLVGRDIEVIYGCSFDGKAFVKDVFSSPVKSGK